ncbi:MAG: M15 family metallopeptidase [Oscillospiraceae bacterium]|nr:M15 family metallopeptidase [Oscillospiraceae bacterium]
MKKHKVYLIAGLVLAAVLMITVILYHMIPGRQLEQEPAVTIGQTEAITAETEDTTVETTIADETTTSQTTLATTTVIAATQTTVTTRAPQQAGWVYPFSFPGVYPAMAHIPSGDSFYLILVNRHNALPDNFTRNHLNLVAAIPGSAQRLHATAARYFHQMYQAGRTAGVVLTPLSGYRDTAHQNRNFNNRIQRERNAGHDMATAVDLATRWVKPPRCSEHETGLAMDIGQISMNFSNTAEYRWLMANAHNFGFILRYPPNSIQHTYVNYEPWHWRFVGVQNATAIRNSGLVLEQWLRRNA